MPTYTEINYNSRGEIALYSTTKTYDVRYIVNFYRLNNSGRADRYVDTSLVMTRTIGNPSRIDGDILDCSFSANIKKGSYRIVAWTDYVDVGSSEDKYYVTDDFAEIYLNTSIEHSGNNDYRDAFRGTTLLDMEGDNEVVVEMMRPVGKYQFIATDLDRLVKNMSSKATREDIMRSISQQDYKVKFTYSGFMPCAYNLLDDFNADSDTNVSFYGEISVLSDSEAQLGFDYVFMNDDDGAVDVGLVILNKNGEVMASTNSISVPMTQGKLTTVRGDFFTAKGSGGIGVNPAFNGDYNIYVD